MTTTFLDISAALDNHLNNMVGLPSVAWPNKSFTPVAGTIYIRPTQLTGDSIPTTNTDDMNIGIYQIDIFTEAGQGKAEIQAMADLIADRFKVDTQMTYNGVTVEVKTVSQKPARNNNDGWYQMPIEIVYYSFTVRR